MACGARPQRSLPDLLADDKRAYIRRSFHFTGEPPMTVRTSVLALFTIAAVAACSDNSATQPMLASRATLSADIGFIEAHPPPPPIDTGAVVETDQGAFTVQTTYFLNKPGNNGFISFANQQADGISVDPNA